MFSWKKWLHYPPPFCTSRVTFRTIGYYKESKVERPVPKIGKNLSKLLWYFEDLSDSRGSRKMWKVQRCMISLQCASEVLAVAKYNLSSIFIILGTKNTLSQVFFLAWNIVFKKANYQKSEKMFLLSHHSIILINTHVFYQISIPGDFLWWYIIFKQDSHNKNSLGFFR